MNTGLNIFSLLLDEISKAGINLEVKEEPRFLPLAVHHLVAIDRGRFSLDRDIFPKP